MIRYSSQNQLPLAEFGWPFQTKLDENNRWVKLARCIPWDALAEITTKTYHPRKVAHRRMPDWLLVRSSSNTN